MVSGIENIDLALGTLLNIVVIWNGSKFKQKILRKSHGRTGDGRGGVVGGRGEWAT